MDYADFGKYLSQQRALRGMGRDEVAKTTRIPAHLLAALEGGEVDRLPGRVFVLNYIRAYAAAIGLEPEEAVLRFEEVDRTQSSPPPPSALERDRRLRAWRTLAIVLAVGAAGGYAALVAAGALPNPLARTAPAPPPTPATPPAP